MIPGITNKQAKFLADLQRQAGETYSGAGMTREQASGEIQRLLAEREVRRAEHNEASSEPAYEPRIKYRRRQPDVDALAAHRSRELNSEAIERAEREP